MYKELVITIVIIVLIIAGNIITQSNTNKSAEEITANLTNFREEITKAEIDKNTIKEHINRIEQLWDEEYEKMAYYIEHDELEKVETELTKLKADVEVEEYHMAVENLDNCIFVLEHIKDKTALKIVNVF